jgi:hypothetical protein
MVTVLSVLAAAAADEEHSKTAFYVAGLVLVAWAVIISVVGTRSAETFPPSKGARTAVCALTALLVAAAMATAVLTG